MGVQERSVALVLQRTKLSEQDLIVTLLGPTRQVRCVAKGARKPSSRLAGIMNLGNVVDLAMNAGRGLPVVREAQLVESHADLALDFDRWCMAEVMLEVAGRLTAEGEHDPRLLPLSRRALSSLHSCDGAASYLAASAFVLKAASMQGYRPSFRYCVICAAKVASEDQVAGFSHVDGGVVCRDCMARCSSLPVDANISAWAASLLGMTFDEIESIAPADVDGKTAVTLLAFARDWLRQYPGIRVKSMDFALEQSF